MGLKITGLRTTLYQFEMARPLGDATLPEGSRLAAGLAAKGICAGKSKVGPVFDEDKLARLEVEALAPGIRAGTWGRRRGAGLYEVPAGEPAELD